MKFCLFALAVTATLALSDEIHDPAMPRRMLRGHDDFGFQGYKKKRDWNDQAQYSMGANPWGGGLPTSYYGGPTYGAPTYGAPTYGAPPYGASTFAPPTYALPAYPAAGTIATTNPIMTSQVPVTTAGTLVTPANQHFASVQWIAQPTDGIITLPAAPTAVTLPTVMPITSDTMIVGADTDDDLNDSLMWLRYFLMANQHQGNNTDISSAPINIPINSSPSSNSSSSSNTFVTISPKPMVTNFPSSNASVQPASGAQYFASDLADQDEEPSFKVSGDSGPPQISSDGIQTTISFVPNANGAPRGETKMMDIQY